MRKEAGWLLPIAATFPFLLFPGRWTAAAVVVLIVGWVAVVFRPKTTPINTALTAPLTLLLITATVSRLIALDPQLADTRYWNIVLQVALFFFILQLNAFRVPIDRLLQAFLLAIGLVIAIGIVATDWSSVRLFSLGFYDQLPSLVPLLSSNGLVASDGINPRIVGNMFGTIAPFLVGYAAYTQARGWRALAIILAVSAGLLIVLTQSAMGIVGLLVGLLTFVGLHYKRLRLVGLIATVSCVAVVLALLFSPLRQIAFDFNHPAGIAIVLRVDMWRQGLAMLHDMPFSGIGINNYPVLLSAFYPGYLVGPEVHAHNTVLQIALDLGLFGLGAVLWFFGRFLQAIHRATPSPHQPILNGCAASVTGYFASGLLDSQAIGHKPLLFFWVIVAIGTALLINQGGLKAKHAVRHMAIALGICCVIMLALPMVRNRNLATVQAHHRLTATSPFQPANSTVLDLLSRAIASNANNPRLYSLRAKLFDAAGQPEQALSDWQQRIAIDRRNPTTRYAPFFAWQQPAQAVSLDAVYRQWRVRYPEQAEVYILSALAADEAAQLRIVEEGLRAVPDPSATLGELKRLFQQP